MKYLLRSNGDKKWLAIYLGRGWVMKGCVRGEGGEPLYCECQLAFSPNQLLSQSHLPSATPFSPTFGATPKILRATPDFEVPQPFE